MPATRSEPLETSSLLLYRSLFFAPPTLITAPTASRYQTSDELIEGGMRKLFARYGTASEALPESDDGLLSERVC
ncbi:hypothetical protein G6O67_007256 [Ophiocordyceps sinensis]|uniref:Uncharacterized protein n=1 Tax=Ophiocordyceps sinensis TaxID=72228 RepID=A0A8H4LUS8_9HYPO|nr:hypothetical protein G6O67_007256 [Ophiocordyceps sinensis]